jgi:hypothetical protein
VTTPYSGTPNENTPYTDAPRGTDGTAFERVIDANAYYNAPVAEPVPTEPAKDVNAPEPVVDARPALEGVGPQFIGTDAEPEGVDMTTLPEFKDMRRMLPSARLKVQMNTAKVATALPAHLKNADTSAGLDFDTMTADDLDALTNVIAAVEATVLDNAVDREAMTEWLLAQAEPLNAVMAAFTKFTDRLGN